jgi:ATP/maltotriose-dependent transcriptional regulator MalT/DNA-binding XRE family transcriptional regulator
MREEMAGEPQAPRAETIGQRLKRLRLERALSQRELAAPGVSYAYISRIEAGTRQPSVKALRRLAAKLGVSAEYLETGSHLPPAGQRELKLIDLELAVRLGESQGAQEPLEAVLADSLAAGDEDAAQRARVALAIVAREAGDFRRMVTLLEDATADEPFAPIERVDVYTNLGFAYSASGRPEAAVALYERCLDAVRGKGVPASLEVRYATALSHALSDAGDLARAEETVKVALDRAGDLEDSYTRVRLYWSLARLAQAEERPTLALSSARKAIALLEATQDTVNLARAQLLAASVMIARGNGDEATRHLDRAERLLGATPSLGDDAMLRVKRAQVAALAGDGAATASLAREALEAIGEELGEERGTAFFALADGLALQGSYSEADDAYKRAVELLEQRQQWREATQACRAWARMLRTAGREQEALDVLDRAAELGLRAAPAESFGDR